MDLRAKLPIDKVEAEFAKHRHRPVVDLAVAVYTRDRESAGMLIGSAIAFRLFLFFVPMLLFTVGLAGFLAQLVHVDTVTETTGVSGQLADQIRTAFEQPNSTRWFAVIAGLFGMATTGRSLSKVLAAASSLSWRLPVSTKASVRVIGATVGLVVGLGLCSTFVNRVRAGFGVPVAGVSFLAVACVYVAVWITLFCLLPRGTKDPGAHIPGAVLVAASLTGLQIVSQLYLPAQIGRASALYGAVGSAVVTLGWFFFLGRMIVVGLSVNAVLYERYGSLSEVIFGLPVVRILPRRSAMIRRVFALEPEPTPAPDEVQTSA